MEKGLEAVRFAHIKTLSGGVITLAFCDQAIGRRKPPPSNFIACGASFCSPSDQFVRSKGRCDSARRLFRTPTFIERTLVSKTKKDKKTGTMINIILSRKVLREMIYQQYADLPTWLKKEINYKYLDSLAKRLDNYLDLVKRYSTSFKNRIKQSGGA